MMLGTNHAFAQVDADNFYKSDSVNVIKVTFDPDRDALAVKTFKVS